MWGSACETEREGLVQEICNFVGGRWEERNGQATKPVYDPAAGEVVAQRPLSSREDVDRAVKVAEAAFPE